MLPLCHFSGFNASGPAWNNSGFRVSRGPRPVLRLPITQFLILCTSL